MAVDLGRVAYQAYIKDIGFMMQKVIQWEELLGIEQNAWRKAAVAVIEQLDLESSQPDDVC